MRQPAPKLIVLYQQIADLTRPECGACKVPHSCCSREYCEYARESVKEAGLELPFNSQARVPYLQDNSCIVPPHLRPMCTMHTCDVNSLGFKPGDPEWTRRYFHLRDQIDLLEMEAYDGIFNEHQ